MTNELREHLLRVEHAIQSVKPLLNQHEYPDDYRTVIVVGFIAQLIEHHEAVLALVMHQKLGSAFALARPIVEGMYRGLWVNVCATDAEIERFIDKDEINRTMAEMAAAIDESYRAGDFFRDLKRRSWDSLNSYAHTGMLQLGRRFTGHEANPSYTDGQVLEITGTLTACVLVLVSRFFARLSYHDTSVRVDALLESY